MKVLESVEEDANAVILIGVFAFRKMGAHFAAFIAAEEGYVEILVVVGKIGGGGFGGGDAIARCELAEISNGKLGFAGVIFEKVLEFRSAMDAGNF